MAQSRPRENLCKMVRCLSNPHSEMRQLQGKQNHIGQMLCTRFTFLGAAGAGLSTRSKKWLGCQDSNLGMAIPKTAALPLGDTPMESGDINAPFCACNTPYAVVRCDRALGGLD